uniref:EF-hand domain-containing protein n=1 Tax=Chromulina nebulosa TaxID=96789 RepID=A0A7S0XCB9_9STRA|mmetsp:Transcript_3035/g.2692  ORF Transcript_3035/g.2692 Transcript_3035/m.2692 type:complete len:444 (+) Transcript_3035:50-1381(+)|eukprot:CAMPEP_0196761968 /NCGR_PEP_ID=MMETSP1095-20130614/1291_1 /TAXON_ID=96789 ORGANISM="Chromulina nebulosa, Strain UTEXLB2642" /NCGR_SAMPLE_ID=MMETSP1095 /ASSEMBLY_ACC=CAM_ASM_000446 /LENGTH=443 /DNA_ID=CAMNT_0042112133 /DNA_START=28 /DNA_END=1359 /DNA_ORIENTATION=-
MGAAASIGQVYHDALSWFREYIDTETYMADFQALDKHKDGGIEYGVLNQWIQDKYDKEGGNWKIFLSNTPILSIAHKMACKSLDKSSSVMQRNIVDVQEFRFFLIQLFAISILWTHFSNAETWTTGKDVGKNHLTKESFYVAYLTITSTHAGEKLSRKQIDDDFDLLDKNSNGTIGFLEVCNYCSQFISTTIPKSTAHKPESGIPKFFGNCEGPVIEIFQDLNTGPRQYYESNTVDQKTSKAIDAIANKMEHEINYAMKTIGVEKLFNQLNEADQKMKLITEEIINDNEVTSQIKAEDIPPPSPRPAEGHIPKSPILVDEASDVPFMPTVNEINSNDVTPVESNSEKSPISVTLVNPDKVSVNEVSTNNTINSPKSTKLLSIKSAKFTTNTNSSKNSVKKSEKDKEEKTSTRISIRNTDKEKEEKSFRSSGKAASISTSAKVK